MTAVLGTPQVEIYAVSSVLGPGWHGITPRVRSDGVDSIEIQHANQGISGGISEPSQCRMTLDCRDGELWPLNPASQFYGSLGLNTPLRFAFELINHDFASVVVDDWAPVGGYTVVNTGAGGTVATSNWQQPGGIATHSVPTVNSHRQSIVDGFDLEDVEQRIDFLLPMADVTGGAVEPANLVFRWTPTRHILLRLVVEADETISIRFLLIDTPGSDLFLTDAYTAPAITHSGQWLRVKGNVEGGRVQAKVWDADDLEPLDWLVDDSPVLLEKNIDLFPGDVGVRTGIAGGNTNSKPITVSYRNWVIRSIQFYGNISEFPLDVDTSGNDLTVPILVAGVSRALFQGDLPVVSTLRRSIPEQPGMRAYWPLEDGRESNSFGSGLPGHPPMLPLVGTPGFAEFSDIASSQPLPTGNGSDWRGEVPPYDDTGVAQVRFMLHLPAGGQPDVSILLRWYTDHPSAKLWQLVYRTTGDLQLQAWNSESAFVYQTSALNFNLDGSTRRISIELVNNGADVDWLISEFDLSGSGSGTFSIGTAPGLQVSTVKRVWANLNFLDTPAWGHITVQDQITDLFDLYAEANAFDRDFLVRRMERLFNDNGAEFTFESADIDNFRMGPQRPNRLDTLVEECVTLDSGGVLYDGRTYAGLNYRDRTALYNQEPWITLSYQDSQLSPPWSPLIDDRDVRNKITVKRDGGSEATYEQETGPKGTQRPGRGGVGTYPITVTVNKFDDTDLQQIAAFRVAQGTTVEPRFPAAVLNLARAELQATPEIARRLLDLRPGRVFEVEGAAAVYQHDSALQMVAGYTMRVTQFQVVYELNGVPATPFDVFVPEDPQRGRIDSASSSLFEALDDNDTEFEIEVTPDDRGRCDLWTTDPAMWPIPLMLAGERMTATEIISTLPAYIATGTVQHADNTGVTPGLPGGATASGDTMVMLTASRNTGLVANTPSGWSVLFTHGSVRLFIKTHAGVGESAPAVTWPAGSAGDTNTAVIASFSDLPLDSLIASAVLTNSSAQNIAFPGVSGVIADGIVFVIGRKSDDWTSVATAPITGAAEIVDNSTTTGSDQGVVWNVLPHNGSVSGSPLASTPSGSLIVTGGGAAVSHGIALLLGNRQRALVTRGVNDVSKAHTAGTAVHIFRPPHWPL